MNATVRLSGNDGTERKFRLPKTSLLAITGLALLGALPATAGVKYWDNPDFKAYDVGDYVQDGLVLHYDGIRNAGAGEAHSDTTDTWANLASDGALPLTWCSWISSDSKYQRVRNDTTQGAWEENGFHFNGQSVFATEESSNLFSLPETYTMQFTMTADLSEATGTSGSGYLFMPGKSWEQGSVGVRNSANGTTTPANAVYVVDRGRFNNTTTRPNFTDATPRYATILGTSASLACFAGTSIPAVGTTYTDSCRANVNARAAHANNWIAFGAQYNGTSGTMRDTVASVQGFNGTLHAIRYYSKALSADDLAWNRVIDEYRFFGASAPIPVTNVVVATAAEGIDGYQPCGAYALDAEGFTFTAPAQRTIKGMRYILNGYTIETWNGSDWGAVVEHDGNAYDATSSGKVRLTWQYERPAGEGQFKTYDVGDYVLDGLLLHYDGIRNVGAAAAHDPDAHQWMNLAPGYESRWPMDWCSYTESSANNYAWHRNDYTQGAWTDDGFAFNGKGYFAKWNDGDTFAVPANFTVQISVTGAIADQLGDPAYLWTGQPGWSYGSIAMRKSNNSAANGNSNSVYYVNSTVHPTERPNFYPAGAKPSYVTAIVDYDDTQTTYIFDGTARPVAGGRDAPAISGTSPATNMTWFSVGGFHGRSGTAANLQSFNGTVHSFRFYNRVLTDAEVAQNRKVDEFRFFGRCDVTVQSTYSYLEGYDKNGCYDVDGSYTFAAPESVTTPNGITYACDGYILETQDGIGWALVGSYESCSYLYETSAGTVRLTWKWKATSGLRTAADYSLADLSPAGLRLHYDGKLNAGVGVAHSDDATKWVNLGSDGAAMDLTRATASGATAEEIGAWTDDGYAFGGHSQFNSGRVQWGDIFTAQCLADADMAANAAAASDAAAKGNHINVFATTWDRMGVRILGDKTVRLNVQGQNTTGPRFSPGDTLTYLTAIEDASAKTASLFSGTVAPTKGSAAQGFTSLSSIGNVYTNALRLGGWGGSLNDSDNVIGTIKSFRYYDRVLTEEELVRNRNVDAARYFGELGVTNVLVAVEEGSGITADPLPGAYFVEGQYTFTVTTGPAGLGYKLSVPDGNGGWQTLSAFAEGGSYTYTDGTSPACVKLEWRLQKPFTIIIR